MARDFRLVLLVGLALVGGCSGSQPSDNSVIVTIDSSYRGLPKSTIDPLSKFAVDTLSDFASQKGDSNVMISPWSVQECFGMLRLGAKGETDQQLKHFLHQRGSAIEQGRDMVGLRKAIAPLMSTNIIRQANGIWVKNGFQISSHFSAESSKFYKAACKQTEFPEPGLSEVNSFVSKETNQLIPKLLSTLDPDTRLVLVNAITFKDQWSSPFEKSMTKDITFMVSSEKSIPVPTMTQSGEYLYGENNQCQWVNLPYRTGLQMLLVLPKSGKTLQTVIRQKGFWEEVSSIYDRRSGTLWIPKWKSDFDWDLKAWMIEHGFSSPYDASANLSGIGSEELSVSQALQRTFIQIDEDGTTAAAATSITAAAADNSAGTPNEPFEFKADHPFAYFVWAPKGIVYFAGIVRNPKGEPN